MSDSFSSFEPENSPDKFAEQIMRFQDATLTPEEIAEFSAEMAGDPDRQRSFIEVQFRSALIREILQRQAYEVSDTPEQQAQEDQSQCSKSSFVGQTSPTRPQNGMGHRVSKFILAALALLAVGGVLFFRKTDRQIARQEALPTAASPSPQVIVAGISHASFFGRGSLTTGQPIHAGDDCMLLSGMVKLAFPSGATAIIEGPAMFRVLNDDALALDTGSCSVHAPDGAEGFRVVTPLTQVVDRGTRFSVKVHESTETEVQVIEGAADLVSAGRPQALAGSSSSKRLSPPREIRLTEQQAVRFSGFGDDHQQPAPFNPDDYRRQLPDRIVSYQAETTDSGCVRELQQVTVQRGGELRTYSSNDLIPIEVTSFRGEEGTDRNGHLLGDETPPPRRHVWLEDLRLDTGVINFGGGETPLDRDPILQGPESTLGLGVRFLSPVINHAGPDVVFFEIQCFTNPLAGDPFHVSPVHFRRGLKSKTVTHYDLTMSSPESGKVPPFWLYRYSGPVRSLEDLSTMAIEPNGGVMRLHFRALAVGIDLSDLGYVEGEQVEELFFQHATIGVGSQVDPVLIAGLPAIVSTAIASTEEVDK